MTIRTHSTKRTRILLAAAISVSLLVVGAASPEGAKAQDVQVTGPLAGAPAVHGLRLWRKNRFQLQPFFAFMLSPEHSRNFFVGGQAQFAFLDYLGVRGWGAWSFAQSDTNLTDQIASRQSTATANRLNIPSNSGFPAQVGQLKWMAGVDVNFIPLRGKLSLFQKLFVDTDLQIFAGVAFVGVEERANTEIGLDAGGSGMQACGPIGGPFTDVGCLASQTARSTRVAIAPTFGAGINMHFAQFMGISIQWRAIPFKWNTAGWDTSGNNGFPDGQIDSDDRASHFNQMLSIGYVLYFPMKIKTLP